MVSNCPQCKIVCFYPWCPIVRAAVSKCPRYQIVCGVKLSAVSNCPVSTCRRCQIVGSVKLSAVSKCPRYQIVLVSNCPRCPTICSVKLSVVSNCPEVKLSPNRCQNICLHKISLKHFFLIGWCWALQVQRWWSRHVWGWTDCRIHFTCLFIIAIYGLF